MLNNYPQPRIGEVYQIRFDGYGSVQKGWRPGIIIQNDIGNKNSPNIIAIPLTSKIKCTNQPTHVYIPARESGLLVDSVALCENPETISKELIGKLITRIPDRYMAQIAKALMVSMPLISYLNHHELNSVWIKTSELVLS